MRTRRVRLLLAAGVAVVGIAAVVTTAIATNRGGFRADLTGYEEVPAVSTVADGKFSAKVSDGGNSFTYKLSYNRLEGNVTQAHIHFGQRQVAGGISVWLCSNLASPPTPVVPGGVQACPAPPATITGTITGDHIVGPANQGLEKGEFQELLRAIRRGLTYANVHSSKFPPGEIRGQIRQHGRR